MKEGSKNINPIDNISLKDLNNGKVHYDHKKVKGQERNYTYYNLIAAVFETEFNKILEKDNNGI